LMTAILTGWNLSVVLICISFSFMSFTNKNDQVAFVPGIQCQQILLIRRLAGNGASPL
jgi:hypothetical protein